MRATDNLSTQLITLDRSDMQPSPARARAHSTTMDVLPLAVYPLIIAHLPVHAAARLALVSGVWNAALAQHLVSADFHTSLQREYLSGNRFEEPDSHAVVDDALRLLGAVTCRLDGPATTIGLVRRLLPFLADHPYSRRVFFEGRGVGGFTEALNKCRHASDWSAEKVLECLGILAVGPLRLLGGYLGGDRIFLTTSLYHHPLEDAYNIAKYLKKFAGAFSNVDGEAVLKLFLDKKMPGCSDRSKVIMFWFASFFPEYDFTEDDAARIGLFVASAALPIADVVDLIERLLEQEDAAEEADWINTRGCLCSVAALRAWARAAAFPTQWPAQARTSMFDALSRWTAANAEQDVSRLVAFEGRLAKLASSWAMELLAPWGVTDGPVLDATRLLQIVCRHE